MIFGTHLTLTVNYPLISRPGKQMPVGLRVAGPGLTRVSGRSARGPASIRLLSDQKMSLVHLTPIGHYQDMFLFIFSLFFVGSTDEPVPDGFDHTAPFIKKKK